MYTYTRLALRVCIDALDPSTKTRQLAFFIRISVRPTWTARRSFSRSLCESGYRVGCFVSLPDTHVYVPVCRKRCNPPSVPLLNFTPSSASRSTMPVLNVTVVSRATASPTRAGNLHACVCIRGLYVCAGARVLVIAGAPCPFCANGGIAFSSSAIFFSQKKKHAMFVFFVIPPCERREIKTEIFTLLFWTPPISRNTSILYFKISHFTSTRLANLLLWLINVLL